jgi:Cft2 family RNA processing exonuclease
MTWTPRTHHKETLESVHSSSHLFPEHQAGKASWIFTTLDESILQQLKKSFIVCSKCTEIENTLL